MIMGLCYNYTYIYNIIHSLHWNLETNYYTMRVVS
jgi:hypothetical protein